MKVICISGHAQSGKDSTATLLNEMLSGRGYSVLVTHYADLLKYICRMFFDWDGLKNDSDRSLLQRVGTDVVRKQRPDYWVDFVISVLQLFPNEWDYVLIPDTRFPNEISQLKEAGFDVVHIGIIRDNFESPLTEEQQKHPSETALDDTVPDITLHNPGQFNEYKEILLGILTSIIERGNKDD